MTYGIAPAKHRKGHAHPGAPAGGGGPGHFANPGSVGLLEPLRADVEHPPDWLTGSPLPKKVIVGKLSDVEKLKRAALLAVPKLPKEAGAKLKSLLTPQALEVMAVLAAVWGAGHFFGASEVVDVALLGVAVYTLGPEALGVARDLKDFVHLATGAKTEPDLDRAADKLARAVATVGIDVIAAVLTHQAFKTVRRFKAGKSAVNAPESPALEEARSAERSGGQTMPAEPAKFDPQQVQAKFKHASDFDVQANYSKANGAKYEMALREHVNAPSTKTIQGTYRGHPVVHKYNPVTGNNVILDTSGSFVSGWRLTPDQTGHLLRTGSLGGD